MKAYMFALLVATAGPDMLDPRQFPPGSMGPKLQAANEFAVATGKPASIGRMEDAERILQGAAGTTIHKSISDVSLRAASP